MGYLNFETQGKAKTTSGDIGKGQVDLSHLSAALFLELQLVKLHTHQGQDSRLLAAAATPEMVKGASPSEREEHGVATWTGGASSSGSIILTFAVAFQTTPDVFVSPAGGDANIQVVTGSVSKTGCTILWKNDTLATQTSVPISWLAKGK